MERDSRLIVNNPKKSYRHDGQLLILVDASRVISNLMSSIDGLASKPMNPSQSIRERDSRIVIGQLGRLLRLHGQFLILDKQVESSKNLSPKSATSYHSQ